MSDFSIRDNLRQAIKPLTIAVLRCVLQVTAIVLLYIYIPLSGVALDLAWLVTAAILAVVVIGIFVRQLIHVSRAEYPILRAAEALIVISTLLICGTGLGAFSMESASSGAFNEPLTRIDAAYYSVTTLATVGFGDIHPVSEGARLFAIGQMLVNLVFLGAAIRLVITVASHAAKSRRRPLLDKVSKD